MGLLVDIVVVETEKAQDGKVRCLREGFVS